MGALVVAGAARNVGGRQRFISDSAPLPAEAAVGASYDLRAEAEGDDEPWRLVPAVEAVIPFYSAPYGKLGVEYEKPFGKGVAGLVRLGYNTRPAPSLGVIAGLAAGVGVKTGRFNFDVGFSPMGDLGTVLRIGTGWRF